MSLASIHSQSAFDAEVQRQIKHVELHLVQGTCTIICSLITQSGFVVVGESHCHNPANFSLDLGARYARENAEAKLAEHLSFLVRYLAWKDANEPKENPNANES